MKKNGEIHFIGIGGIGVSALARYFLAHNFNVSGSDFEASEITKQLKKEGVKIFIGHKASNVNHLDSLIIHSAAIKQDNPEIIKAKKIGLPIKTYSQALGDLTKKYTTISVSGAHGKSTTTAMLSLVLEHSGLDPSVIIGTKLKEFKNSNFRNGKSDYLVIEADEYSAAFLNYFPSFSIITNIDREHLDFYENLTNIKKTFLSFIKNIKSNGILVLNEDDANLYSLKNKIQKIAQKNKFFIEWYGFKNKKTKKIADKLKKTLKVPGEHNLSNALAAYTLARRLGINEKNILNSLTKFNGTWRRMEYRGDFTPLSGEKCRIFDDYAHHPTEIRSTIAGICEKWPKSAIICVFQPHQAKRLKLLFSAFIRAFNGADALILLDLYKVKGREEMSQNITSEKLAKEISKIKSAPFSVYLPEKKYLKKTINEILKSINIDKPKSPIIVMMGAGDIYKLTNNLLQ